MQNTKLTYTMMSIYMLMVETEIEMKKGMPCIVVKIFSNQNR